MKINFLLIRNILEHEYHEHRIMSSICLKI